MSQLPATRKPNCEHLNSFRDSLWWTNSPSLSSGFFLSISAILLMWISASACKSLLNAFSYISQGSLEEQNHWEVSKCLITERLRTFAPSSRLGPSVEEWLSLTGNGETLELEILVLSWSFNSLLLIGRLSSTDHFLLFLWSEPICTLQC